MTRRLTDRGEERRTQIVAFATERFAEKGYHPTSVAEIVKGLGVGKGVFYWYFASKEELFLAILRDAQLELRRLQQQAIAEAQTPLERLALGIRASVRWSAAHRNLTTLVAFAATDDRFKRAIERGQQVAVADVMRHVTEAIAEGAIPDQDPLVLTRAMFGVTTELTRCFLSGPGTPPDALIDEIAGAAVAFCLGGLTGRQGVEITKKSRDSVER